MAWKFHHKDGWHICRAKMSDCTKACDVLGDECGEISYTQNGCCFLAKGKCTGTRRVRDTKFVSALYDGSPGESSCVEERCVQRCEEKGWRRVDGRRHLQSAEATLRRHPPELSIP